MLGRAGPASPGMLQEGDWACPCKEASQQLGCYLGPQSWGWSLFSRPGGGLL